MLNNLTAQIGSRPLGLARIIIGTAAAIRAVVAWPVLTKLTETTTLKAPYFDWYPEPTMALVAVVLSVWFVAAVLMTLGWKVGPSGSALLASIVFTLGLDQQAYSNHLYLMAWLVLLLVIADAGAGMTVARQNRPVIRWPVIMMMLQASVVYGFAAITKLNEEFLSGRALAGVLHGGLIQFPEGLRTPQFLMPLAVATVFVELFLAIFLWTPGLRPAAFVLGLGFHVSIVLLMPDTWELLVFTLEMLALYPLFLSRDNLVVVWDSDCGSCAEWIRRFQRFDVLRVVEPVVKDAAPSGIDPEDVERSLHLVHMGQTTRGFAAVTRILEHLVPTLWIAPILRLPGLKGLGERWYRWQAARRTCPAGLTRMGQ